MKAPTRFFPALLAVFLLCPAPGLAQESAENPPRSHTVGAYLSGFWDEFNQVWSKADYERFRLEYENDLFYNTDRNYTDGVRLSLKHGSDKATVFDPEGRGGIVPPLNTDAEKGDCPVEAASSAEDYTPGFKANPAKPDPGGRAPRPYCYKAAYSVVLGQNMYTPSDIRLQPSQIPAKDHPYAAWLYMGVHREVYSSDERYWQYGFDVGCIGPCALGEQAQKFIHKYVTDSPAPQGWGSQIHNELGIEFRYEHAWRALRYVPGRAGDKQPGMLGENLFGVPLAFDLRPAVSVGLGNIQTYAGLGATARLGWFRSTYDSMRLDTHPIESLASRDQDDATLPTLFAQTDTPAAGAAATDGVQAPKYRPQSEGQTGRAASAAAVAAKPELFGFARVNADLVAYNAMLQGGLINDSSPKTVGARPLIAEYELGLAAAYRQLSVSFSSIIRHEWDTSGARYGQRFGRIAVEFSTRF